MLTSFFEKVKTAVRNIIILQIFIRYKGAHDDGVVLSRYDGNGVDLELAGHAGVTATHDWKLLSHLTSRQPPATEPQPQHVFFVGRKGSAAHGNGMLNTRFLRMRMTRAPPDRCAIRCNTREPRALKPGQRFVQPPTLWKLRNSSLTASSTM